jgi:hypothetical protein
MSGYAASARDGALDQGQKALEQSSRLLNDLRTRGTEFAHEQPLIVAAVGIALGAAVAALLPRTQAEDSLMGEPGCLNEPSVMPLLNSTSRQDGCGECRRRSEGFGHSPWPSAAGALMRSAL